MGMEMATITNTGNASAAPTAGVGRLRWIQLLCCVLCMVMIANLQYGWTYFVNPIRDAHKLWGFEFFGYRFDAIASIQLAFSIFIALETWLTPIEGWFVDLLGPKNGPRLMVAF